MSSRGLGRYGRPKLVLKALYVEPDVWARVLERSGSWPKTSAAEFTRQALREKLERAEEEDSAGAAAQRKVRALAKRAARVKTAITRKGSGKCKVSRKRSVGRRR